MTTVDPLVLKAIREELSNTCEPEEYLTASVETLKEVLVELVRVMDHAVEGDLQNPSEEKKEYIASMMRHAFTLNNTLTEASDVLLKGTILYLAASINGSESYAKSLVDFMLNESSPGMVNPDLASKIHTNIAIKKAKSPTVH